MIVLGGVVVFCFDVGEGCGIFRGCWSLMDVEYRRYDQFQGSHRLKLRLWPRYYYNILILSD